MTYEEASRRLAQIRALVEVASNMPATEESEQLIAELMAEAREHAEEVYGRISPQWAEVWSRGVSGTCMLPHGYDGPHQFTPDDKIGVTFEPANPHPSGCHTEAPGSRDCYSDGHESCYSCSRRAERDEEVWREGGIVVPPRGRDR